MPSRLALFRVLAISAGLLLADAFAQARTAYAAPSNTDTHYKAKAP